LLGRPKFTNYAFATARARPVGGFDLDDQVDLFLADFEGEASADDAAPGERARRRYEELKAAGRPVDLQVTLGEIAERDKRDSERDIAPLCKADDALLVDSSAVDAEQVAALVLNQIKHKAKVN
jgi:hypothetical protein